MELDPLSPELISYAQMLVRQALAETAPAEEPLFIHLCGVPGSGKSTYAKRLHATLQNVFLLDFDRVMEALPPYQQERESGDYAAAFRHWELPARQIGYHLLRRLMHEQRSILFDHSAANPSHPLILAEAKTLGYRTEMHQLVCQPELALTRIACRETLLQRYTPPHLVHERSALLRELIPQYRHLVDQFVEVVEMPEELELAAL